VEVLRAVEEYPILPKRVASLYRSEREAAVLAAKLRAIGAAHMLLRYLSEHNLAVRAVGDGGALDRALAREPADAIVLDLTLPGEDGLAICRRLRAQGDGYDARLDALADELAAALAKLFDTLPPRTLAYVFGDHGFVLGPGASGWATGAGSQGGSSPEEVLVGGQAWLLDAMH
jgi:CheY-like chemotaxis protein